MEQNLAEDASVVDRINSTARRLHELWSVRPEDDDRPRWHAQVAGVQAELDRLYERRRELLATRTLLLEDSGPRRGRIRPELVAA